ncbi:CO dehydrogenase flavoprotein C-terminal domain [Acididesulfobacillus acetoxydans]|uniref:CO dehydrogenase flavoprotein C-terminal domain n=1 Tax=Acididesulfobacillus acetoxydans TaxID=1561005 RepID=A0A8S0WFD6_9FIRM|nr:xanthine dehydrogenase family protein subunit M [Acididesulfobacillus acetoxydans]CAA7600942.1 CO dehydrogenase flavoprotein C-terminal domain [Acididesulfobacillus acetoxydans]CEJ08902.1 Xanthine dehydrogenase FAD-binding subunit [Acididesulfobacillus acetoxydans]
MDSDFLYIKPPSLSDLLNHLESWGEKSKVLAGGTDLLVLLRRHDLSPSYVVDIKGIEELQRLEEVEGGDIFLGAGLTVNEAAHSGLVQKRYKALADAANKLASYQLRNRATVVGNICNASPGADLAGPLLVFDAKVQIVSTQGKREVLLQDFFTGVKKTILRPQELLYGLTLPAVTAGERSIYLKLARIKGHDLGIVGVAGRLDSRKKFHLAMSSVAPTPLRLTRLEALLNGSSRSAELPDQAAEAVQEEIRPISDVRASAAYRQHMAGVLVKRVVQYLVQEGGE